MEPTQQKLVLKYNKLNSKLGVTFYMEYQKKILDDFKYHNHITPIYGFYDVNSNLNLLRFENYSFDITKSNIKSGTTFYLKGLLYHYSIQEDFESFALQEDLAKRIDEENANSPNMPVSFVLYSFADLKNYLFYSSLVEIDYKYQSKFKKIKSVGKEKEMSDFVKQVLTNHFELLKPERKEYLYNSILPLKEKNEYLIFDIYGERTTFPVFLKSHIYGIHNHTNTNELKLFLIKDAFHGDLTNFSFQNSVMVGFDSIGGTVKLADYYSKEFVKPDVKMTDLKATFDPLSIAEKAVDLNLNLTKWRMSPDLDIDVIKKTRFLLFGAGTLGCHVSRNLLGWGARNITFIDNGKVSYSNPMRQSLYNFEDSKEGQPKALVAAKRLKEICPFVNAQGYECQIPLPGRTANSEKAIESFMKNVSFLEDQIREHDVIFLLTDSRESRWLPTLLARVYDKECITAAVGFDSYLVLRHGREQNNKGCYFCSDFVSPTDTTGRRTLDQQCTISRAGISGICSGYTTEIGISILQHGSLSNNLPFCIRASLYDYTMMTPDTHHFTNCVGCSKFVRDDFIQNRNRFLLGVMNDPNYLEVICQIDKLLNVTDIDDKLISIDEDDF